MASLSSSKVQTLHKCRGSHCSSRNVIARSHVDRRAVLSSVLVAPLLINQAADAEALSKYEPMDALKGKDYGKSRMRYPDYIETPSGLQYKDLREGNGDAVVKDGNTVLVDWDGYTIGYYGRPFEARNKPKGSSFTGEDKDYVRITVGDHKVIPAFEEALQGMKVGSVRRIIVPVELGYPDNDYNKLGPKPSNFAGERALGFVLGNKGMIDKTLLFDIEVMRIVS